LNRLWASIGHTHTGCNAAEWTRLGLTETVQGKDTSDFASSLHDSWRDNATCQLLELRPSIFVSSIGYPSVGVMLRISMIFILIYIKVPRLITTWTILPG
jgi:hypothetical protein